MSSKYFNLVFLFTFSELFSISNTDQWYKTYCEDSVCLYFNGTNVLTSSNDEANSICKRSGFMLLEIPNAKINQIVDRATSSWDDYARPLNGFYFRLNLVQVLDSKWTWIGTNQPLDSSVSILNYPYFATAQINSSGIYYSTEFERSKYPSICSCNGPCKNSVSCSISDSGSNLCIEVVNIDANWFDSRSNCQNMGGDLAIVVQSPSPQWISNVPAGSYWIGLTRAKYVWNSNAETSTYFKWSEGEPIQGHECTCISHKDYRSPNYFVKSPCFDGKPFICMNATGNYSQTFFSLTSPLFSTSSSSSSAPIPNPLPSTTLTTSSSFVPPTATTKAVTTTSATTVSTTVTSYVQTLTTEPQSSSLVGIIAGVSTFALLLIVLLIIVLLLVLKHLKKNKDPTYQTTIDDLLTVGKRNSSNVYETEISVRTSGTIYGPYDNMEATDKYEEIGECSIYDELNEKSFQEKTFQDGDSKYYQEVNGLDRLSSQNITDDNCSHLDKDIFNRNSKCLTNLPTSNDHDEPHSVTEENKDFPTVKSLREMDENKRIS